MKKSNVSQDNLLYHKLNQETGKINWHELQRHFARGVVIVVAKDLDLVKIAEQISNDEGALIEPHLKSEKIYRATDQDALRWNDQNQSFWAVVIAPWVLVQES